LDGVQGVGIEHVFANGSKDDVHGELRQAALALGSKDGVRLDLSAFVLTFIKMEACLPFQTQTRPT
jgi:hypothetical protein